MSSLSITEFNAAQALLDLHNGNQDNTKDAETAKLPQSCLVITDEAEIPVQNTITISETETINDVSVVLDNNTSTSSTEPSTSSQTPKRKFSDNETLTDGKSREREEKYTSKRSRLFKRKPNKHFSVALNKNLDKKNITTENSNEENGIVLAGVNVETRDIGIQTEGSGELPDSNIIASTLIELYEKITSLEAQIQTIHVGATENDVEDDDDDDDDKTYKPDANDTSESDEDSETDESSKSSKSEIKVKNKAGSSRSVINSSQILSNRSINTENDDMIPIGIGNAKIPARIFKYINWNSYTSATRKLLTSVFSRSVLATHSLTGKRPPAFPSKPRKKKLDAALVNDIVQTVVERCGVPENLVRTSITTKCADESKMLRTRQNKKKRQYKVNKENIPSDTESE